MILTSKEAKELLEKERLNTKDEDGLNIVLMLAIVLEKLQKH